MFFIFFEFPLWSFTFIVLFLLISLLIVVHAICFVFTVWMAIYHDFDPEIFLFLLQFFLCVTHHWKKSYTPLKKPSFQAKLTPMRLKSWPCHAMQDDPHFYQLSHAVPSISRKAYEFPYLKNDVERNWKLLLWKSTEKKFLCSTGICWIFAQFLKKDAYSTFEPKYVRKFPYFFYQCRPCWFKVWAVYLRALCCLIQYIYVTPS